MNAYPHYPDHLNDLIAQIVLAGVTKRSRSFRTDSARAIARLQPPPKLEGAQYQPASGPGLVVCNHYYRPGFEAWWIAMSISAMLPTEIHWVIAAERRFAAPIVRSLEKRFLAWASQVYGFFAMPAMPPQPNEARQRALVVGRVVDFVRRSASPLVGLAPEGGDMPGGQLSLPPPGSGRFMLELNRLGLPLYPVGVFEEEGYLCLRAGPSFQIQLPAGLLGEELDHQAGLQVMHHLADLVPPRLRGEF